MPANRQNKRAVYLLETDETGDYRETTRGGIYSTTTKAAKAIAKEINSNLKEISLADAKTDIDPAKSNSEWRVAIHAGIAFKSNAEPATAKTVCGDNMSDGWDSLGRDDFTIKWTDSNTKYDNNQGVAPFFRFKTICIKWQSVKRVLDTLEIGFYGQSDNFHFDFEESDYSVIEKVSDYSREYGIHCVSITKEELL
jgi:hypothetical protein